MASQPGVKVEGLKGLVRALKRAEADDLLALLKAANAEAAKDVEQTARPLAPVLTGRLVGSLRSSGTARAGVVRLGKASVPYAQPIHFGWPKRHIQPQPFLYEALDRRIEEVTRLYHERVEELAEAIAGARD